MTGVTDPLAWAARAEEVYTLARSSLRRKAPLTYGACFHAQQCAEKYLKALLISKGQAFPKTHDLLILDGLCASAGIIPKVGSHQLSILSAYAVQVRYPGTDPTPAEAQEALRISADVRRAARKELGL